MKTILVDIDNTTAHWDKKFISHLALCCPWVETIPFGQRTHKDAQRSKEIGELPEVKHAMSLAGFYRDLEPIEGSIETLKQLKADGFDVRFCSAPARNNPYSATEKLQWITEHYGKEWATESILTSAKHYVKGTVLIDDIIQEGSDTAEWTHILFRRSYNEHLEVPYSIYDWDYDNLINMINQIN